MKKTRVWMMMAVVLFTASVAKADVFGDIAAAIRSGSAKEVSRYFGTTVELKTVDKSGVYSKNQAEQVLKDFFEGNPPRSFDIIHKGSSAKGAQYAIGTLVTPSGNYRAYVYIADVGGQQVIQELSFEKE